MKSLLCALLVTLTSWSPLAAQPLFRLEKVVEGVYAAISRPQYQTNCNAGIVILEDGVLVVDTHSKPSAAQALIQEIKALTPLPVKYVVNTHFHWDHYQGNSAYPNAWPAGLEIIASETTRRNIQSLGIPRVKREMIEVPREIERLKAQLEAADGPARAILIETLKQTEVYLGDLQSMQVTLPSLTLERSLVLYRPTRTVEILWLGRGHTDGDVVVYLPREKVLISGDLLHGGTPYMGDSYPHDWIRTLDQLERLDFDYLVSGHGDVMQGKGRLQLWKTYLEELMQETTDAYTAGATLEDVRRDVAATLVARYGTRLSADFSTRVVPNVEKAYRVVSGTVD